MGRGGEQKAMASACKFFNPERLLERNSSFIKILKCVGKKVTPKNFYLDNQIED